VLLRRRADPWWRFVLFGLLTGPVAASFTTDRNSLRMIALPVFLPLLGLPALELIASLPRPRGRAAMVAAAIAVLAVEAVHWQLVFRRNGPGRGGVFDVQAHSLIDAAFRRGGTVYASHAHGFYIDFLLDGVAAGRSSSS